MVYILKSWIISIFFNWYPPFRSVRGFGSSIQLRFQFLCFREQDIVLQMDVPMQVVLKFLEHSESDFVCTTGIFGRRIVVAQSLDLPEAFPFVVVFVHHGLNGVFDGTETGCIQG